MRAFKQSQVIQFTVPGDADGTVFHLSLIPHTLYAALKDEAIIVDASSGTVSAMDINTLYTSLVTYGLKGYDNFPGSVPPKFVKRRVRGVEYDGLSDDTLLQLRHAIIEIGVEIFRHNELTEQDAKNSASPSGSPATPAS